VEYKKVIEPVRIEGDPGSGSVRITNTHDFTDLSHLRFAWSYEIDGAGVAQDALTVPPLAAGESTELKLPVPEAAGLHGEAHWLVRAVLREDTAWAEAGHEVAWGQWPAVSTPGPAGPEPVPHTPRAGEGGVLVFGAGTFDAATGELRYLDGFQVAGPRLDIWRAPTDNDLGAPWHARTGPSAGRPRRTADRPLTRGRCPALRRRAGAGRRTRVRR
jgi:beta-galactosidase